MSSENSRGAGLTPERLNELREINRSVPEEPWKVWPSLHGDPKVQVDKPGWHFVAEASKDTPEYGRIMAERIAAFDPPTVAALLDLIDRQAEALRAVRRG
ncbi:hypothetical protein D477_014236 [Arthrobacter crystallopoietes BAB-32]|uniref:Uncharacterized protein n=1 Tax=Arthrobacter crystallopoietes BAB-32 TaxID=1246476 RepID=N1V0F6_9MICC|nr:hypothetical protein [Arthrobacter crystallopoietes]EMY33567.1 hypothetical protein D477_014236 [Arthrobacter crystallopoietes BAB-32]